MKTETRIISTAARRMALALLFLVCCASAPAAEVDLSCMSHSVLGKKPVTDRYKEYDVVLTNRCPGPVYWTMCIERLDPQSHKILEVHTPSGVVEEERKSRVNLQMKTGPDSMSFQKRYQEFYLNIGYAIQPPAKTSCAARQCESEISELRSQIDANQAVWQKAEANLSKQLASECPESGWGKTEEVDSCEAAIREALGPKIEKLAETDVQLREQLVNSGQGGCQLHGGDLFEKPRR